MSGSMQGPGGYRNPIPGGDDFSAAEELWVQSGAAGVLLLVELDTPPDATSGTGKVYVKESDGLLYYKDGSGTEFLLSADGVGAWQTPTGSVNGSNTAFTVAEEPTEVLADGLVLVDGAGYSYAALTITLDNPPASFIRYR